MISAAVVLHERITVFAAAGGLLILLGVYLSQKRVPGPEKEQGLQKKLNNRAVLADRKVILFL